MSIDNETHVVHEDVTSFFFVPLSKSRLEDTMRRKFIDHEKERILTDIVRHAALDFLKCWRGWVDISLC